MDMSVQIALYTRCPLTKVLRAMDVIRTIGILLRKQIRLLVTPIFYPTS